MLYYDPAGDAERRLLAAGAARGPNARHLLGLLVRRSLATASGAVTIRRLAASEIPADWLEGWGFTRGARNLAFDSQAAPG